MRRLEKLILGWYYEHLLAKKEKLFRKTMELNAEINSIEFQLERLANNGKK